MLQLKSIESNPCWKRRKMISDSFRSSLTQRDLKIHSKTLTHWFLRLASHQFLNIEVAACMMYSSNGVRTENESIPLRRIHSWKCQLKCRRLMKLNLVKITMVTSGADLYRFSRKYSMTAKQIQVHILLRMKPILKTCCTYNPNHIRHPSALTMDHFIHRSKYRTIPNALMSWLQALFL